VLAKKADGSCVFLTEAARCRIHELYGADAKPTVCRMFPFQLVPLEQYSYLTLRRGCPSAAADKGRPLRDHASSLMKSDLIERFSKRQPPPLVTGRAKLSWSDWLAVADALTRLTTDERLPLVRRLVHGLRFCLLLEQCTLGRIDSTTLREVINLLETSAPDGVGELFRVRPPPTSAASFLFRQTAVHYIRSHPSFPVASKRNNPLRLMWLSARFARGRGAVPDMHPHFPTTTFKQLERPLGALATDLLSPLDRYFTTQAASRHYAIVGHRRSLVRSYRSLVFAYPMALWLLRLAIGDREATVDDVIDVVVTLDRAQGTATVDRVANLLSNSDQLERLLAWYGR
jgi:lysine-N-methylase